MFHTGRGGGGGVLRRANLSDFKSIYFNMQQNLSYKPSGAPEATRSNLRGPKFIKFPVGVSPRRSVLCMIDSFPSLTKTQTQAIIVDL